jgi:RND family efflux transporter MFP subunit
MKYALVAVLVACGSKEQPQPPPPPVVDVATLQPTDVVESTEYLGRLRSRTAAVIQPQVAGRITDILVKPGDVVDAGRPLAKIDPGGQPAAVAQAQAGRQAAQAQLALAEQNLARIKQLVDQRALPRQELDNAQAAVTSARAQVAAQGAQITGSQTQLRYYTVLSPSHGTVGDIPARVGDTVSPQTRLTSVVDNATLEVNVAIPVDRAAQLGAATRIEVLDDTGHAVGSGTVKFVSPDVDPTTQTVLVKADVANPEGVLRTDQIARARVIWKTEQGLRVPALAVSRIGDQVFVFVATGTVVKQRPIKVGELIDNTYVVVSGLKAGERIATSNIQKLRDGALIQPKG